MCLYYLHNKDEVEVDYVLCVLYTQCIPVIYVQVH